MKKTMDIKEVQKASSQFKSLDIFYDLALGEVELSPVFEDEQPSCGRWASIMSTKQDDREGRMNAILIAHCYNTFEPMLEALKEAHQGLAVAKGVIEHAYGKNSMVIEDAIGSIKDILAKAEKVDVQGE